ncbi:MotA/TolQ/ExbB proton channel family protein [bacterium]|nr:MotA/TolQ/ExbB proton channel family protein [bacterium]
MLNKYFFTNSYRSAITKFLATLSNQSDIKYIEDSCTPFTKGIAKTIPIILIKLIRSYNQGRHLISPETIVSNAVTHEVNRLQKWMAVLATTANISPLLGLLGTVWGIMGSFLNISQSGNATIATVAPGIAEALMTTIAGLCVAIPAMAGHNFLSTGINACLDSLEKIGEFSIKLFTNGGNE